MTAVIVYLLIALALAATFVAAAAILAKDDMPITRQSHCRLVLTRHGYRCVELNYG